LPPWRLKAQRCANPEPERHPLNHPVLRFTPTAWAKLLYIAHAGDTEVGGFGIASDTDPLLVIDFAVVKQKTTEVTVAFDDQAVAEFFEQQVDMGRKPEQFARLWIHSHPGSSPHPSLTDEDTFRRVFGSCHWAVMFIIARDGTTYARLRFNIGPGGETTLPVRVDYSQPFAASDFAAWKQEYLAKVQPEVWRSGYVSGWNHPRRGLDRHDAAKLAQLAEREWRGEKLSKDEVLELERLVALDRSIQEQQADAGGRADSGLDATDAARLAELTERERQGQGFSEAEMVELERLEALDDLIEAQHYEADMEALYGQATVVTADDRQWLELTTRDVPAGTTGVSV